MSGTSLVDPATGYLTDDGWLAFGFRRHPEGGWGLDTPFHHKTYRLFAKHTPASLVQTMLRVSFEHGVDQERRGLAEERRP